MKRQANRVLLLTTLAAWTISCDQTSPRPAAAAPAPSTNVQAFLVKGIVLQLKSDGRTVVVKHEAIPNYMAAMTMPFRAKDSRELVAVRLGDEISFRLSVTGEESWIDHVRKTGHNFPVDSSGAPDGLTNTVSAAANVLEALSTYTFTNEFGKSVRLSDYRGAAIAFTFFFTRCPVPEYCPRLTKNFAGAIAKLKRTPGAATNWHFFSISFDPEFDTPAVLRGYGRTYGYDSNRWSFLTASIDDMREITARFGFNAQKSAAGFDHNFLTVVLDAGGYMQSAWPIGGDTTDSLVAEMMKATGATNRDPQAP